MSRHSPDEVRREGVTFRTEDTVQEKALARRGTKSLKSSKQVHGTKAGPRRGIVADGVNSELTVQSIHLEDF